MTHSTLTRALVILIASYCGAAHAADSTSPWCNDPSSAPDNTVVFDHLEGHVLSQTPVVLELRGGAVFEVVFCRTVPAKFNYEITPIAEDKEDTTLFDSGTKPAPVDAGDLTWTSVDRKHKDDYSLYKVTVTLRQGTNNPRVGARQREATPSEPVYLYSYAFPIWVKTVSWDMSFSTGVTFSDLTNDKFFIETDTEDDTKRVRRDSSDIGDSRPDLVLFANLRTPDAGWWTKGETRRFLSARAGLAFGVGLNGDGDPRYFFGPSWTIGRKNNFVLIAGWAGGQVDRLPAGQEVGEAPLNDNILNNLDSSFEHGFFAGLTFTFNGPEDDDFVKTLTGQTKRTDTASEESQRTSND